jgi:hypothetical protein
MVSAALALVALLAAETSPVGVVRVARGAVEVRRPAAQPARTGLEVHAGDRVVVGASGWTELLLGPSLRARLSARSRLDLRGPASLALRGGRAWLAQAAASATVTVSVDGRAVRVGPRSSVVLEATPPGRVAVVRGAAVVGPARVRAGQAARLEPDLRVLDGSAEALTVVRREARAALGDLEGWRALVLERVRATRARGAPLASTRAQLRARGLEGRAGAARLLVEEALRPPPFFAEEIPPAGPNARIRIRFDDD